MMMLFVDDGSPLDPSSGQAGQVVHNTWQELSKGSFPQPKFKDILMGEDLFSLETTDNLPNVTTLNLNWLLGEAVRTCARRFVPCLRLMVRKSSTPLAC